MKLLFIFLLVLTLFGCAKKDKGTYINIKETSQELEMISSYKEAFKSLNEGDPYFAAKKFLEAEILYPQSEWASRSALMASYSYYLQNYYIESVANLERFLITYPNDRNIAYAHYLIGMCFYESIVDEKRDSASILKAKKKFDYIVKNYPSSQFALDANFKLELINNILASKEMYIGRYYIKKEKWIASINRFQTVIKNYDQTIFIEEALHRLVEINYKLGLEDEANEYAAILGYNYLSSEWYKNSYKIFNQKYSDNFSKNIKKDKKGVLNKFKNLF
jgi:outer membrane protein assembly factor BamD